MYELQDLATQSIHQQWATEEGRKEYQRVLGIMAAILAARKLAQFDPVRNVPATISTIADSVQWAEKILIEN